MTEEEFARHIARLSAKEHEFPDDPYAWAVWYRSRGISVIPVNPDGKSDPEKAKNPYFKLLPKEGGEAVWTPYKNRLATDEELEAWFKRDEKDGGGLFDARLETPPGGIGIVTGAISGGLVMIEAESEEILGAFEEAMGDHGLEGVWEKLELRVRSGRGGTHLYYRCPEACGGPLKLANKSKENGGKPLIETRAEGGYAVAPGSPARTHPEGRYTLESGSFERIPILSSEEQDALYAVARTLDQAEPREKPAGYAAPAEGCDGGLRPGDDFNRRCTVEELAEILQDAGWHSPRRTRRGMSLTRPGKDSGTGGVVLEPGDRCPITVFYCHTTSTEFEPKAYSPFAVLAIARHGGEFGDAASHLRGEGYGGEPSNSYHSYHSYPKEGGGGDGSEGKEEEKRSRSPYRGKNGNNGKNSGWSPGDEWEDEFQPVPPDALPSWPSAPPQLAIHLRTEKIAEALGVPPEMVGPVQLSVLATCAQRRAVVLHPGSDHHREPLCFWSCVIAPSGSRKSAVGRLPEPLFEIQEKLLKDASTLLSVWESEDRVIAGNIRELERLASKIGESKEKHRQDITAEIQRKEKHLSSRPPSAAFLTSDFTPEALDQLMHDNDHRVAVFDSEGSIIVSLANVRAGQPVKDGNLCKYHSAEPVIVHRKGSSDGGGRAAWNIDGGTLSMGIMLQGSKMQQLLDSNQLMESGFAARFCYSKVPRFSPPYDSRMGSVLDSWDSSIISLWFDLPEKTFTRRECPAIELSPDAGAIHREYAASISDRQGVAMDHHKSWLGKAAGCSLRIAALLHCLSHRNQSLEKPIDAETMGYAVQIMDYFEVNARLLFERSIDHEFTEALSFLDPFLRRPAILEEMEEAQGIVPMHRFNRWFRSMSNEKVLTGMASLEAIGWARELRVERHGAGRKGMQWQIRPEAIEEMRRMRNRKAAMG